MKMPKINCTVLLAGAVVMLIGTWSSPVRSAHMSDLDQLPSTIPLFPLQDVALFPNMSRPLHVFEPRYREMMADAVEGGGYIGMVLLQPGHEDEYGGNPPVFSIGCAGKIAEANETEDGRWFILLHGTTRFRIVNEDQSGAYRVAVVEPIPERLDDDDRTALSKRRPELIYALNSLLPGSEPPPADLSDEDFVNGLAQFLALDPLDRQQLLEAAGPLERANALLELMR